MTISRFKEHLTQQLKFIENSCDAYDRGERTETIRIGTSLRVLFNNTQRSPSLLKHLGEEQVPILSTSKIHESISGDFAFDGLTGFSSAGIHPKFGKSSTLTELPANDWWQQPVIGLGDGIILSRKYIALIAANKDGGAHVDIELPKDYQKLVDGVWISSTGDGPYINHQFHYLRQMGYEILNSPKLLAISDYKSRVNPRQEAVLASGEMVLTNFEARSIPPEEKEKLLEEINLQKLHKSPKPGRNEPCTCGSGKKSKKCCWK